MDNTGICHVCRNAPVCNYTKDAAHLIINCEDFQGLARSSSTKKIGVHLVPGVPESPKGICASCEDSDSCTLPRPTSGVWFCTKWECGE